MIHNYSIMFYSIMLIYKSLSIIYSYSVGMVNRKLNWFSPHPSITWQKMDSQTRLL